MIERELLRLLGDGAPHASTELAQHMEISRAAVRAQVARLRGAGVPVIGHRSGYALPQPLVLLNAQRIRLQMPAELRRRMPPLQVLWRCDSTNAELLRRAEAGDADSILLAEQQTAGRGRHGRRWSSPLAAHLYLSLSRRFALPPAGLAGLSLAVGIAAAEALQACGARQLGLKWPNDVLVDGRKLGGVLIELTGPRNAATAAPAESAEMPASCVVIGIGINVCMPAAAAREIDQPWCDLAGLLRDPPDRNRLAARLIERLLPALDQFERDGLAGFRARWDAFDVLRGEAVRILHGSGDHEGIALGIEDDGALRIRHADGERSYHGGEVSLRPA